MQRVSGTRPYLRSVVPGTLRKNSTLPTPEPAASNPAPKLKLKRWEDLVIPSRDEVLAKRKEAEAAALQAASKSQTDIRYLKFESNSSLAARLARPTLDIQERMQQEKIDAMEAATPDADAGTNQPIRINLPKPRLSPAEQRRALRLAREEALAQETKAKAERAERKRVHAEREILSQTKHELNNLNVISKTLHGISSPRSEPTVAAPLSERMKLAFESAAKRRAERLARLANPPVSAGQKGMQGGRQTRHRTSDKLPDNIEEFEVVGVVDDHLPELKGPIAPRVDLLPIRQPVKVADYASYVPESLSFALPADNVYRPSQLVQMVLSHRPDVSIPKRKHALEIVQKFTKSAKVSLPA